MKLYLGGGDQSEAKNRGDRYGATTNRCMELMWRSCVRQLIPGSGPQRTPRRGAAGSDANSPDIHVSRECEQPPASMPLRSRPTPTGANAGRPACVCAAEHARRAPRFACCAPDRLAHHLRLGIAATSEVQSTLVRPPPALTGSRSVRRATRLPCCRRRCLPGHRGTITLIQNRCFGPLADRMDHSDEGQKRRGRAAAR
ncbi:hypothetical protein EVAR_43662_1 [Eumeta japonica]|uniref:Uncharacterized protein n=1 Tax=Eumeta variegata TaxID=151549 RepID=A0A4C1XYH3_EUMVA|nr:hypothetical protein EVAR_43662_1 [Eumeta japonica]